jgi:transposase
MLIAENRISISLNATIKEDLRDDKVLTLDRFLYKYPCICPKCGKRGYLYERYKRSHTALRGPYLLVRHRVSSNYDKRRYRLARLNGLEPVPKDPFVEAESVRTNIPAVRAAYKEGKTPRFFRYATGRGIYPGWFSR